MRPFLILSAVVLMAVAAFGQQPFPHPIYGPYVPLITTPEISLQQVSPNPVGASNATTGLIAGATNATLSQVTGSTSSVHTEAVWYQGGDAPLTSPQVHLWPETIGREGHVIRELREEHTRDEHGARGSEEARASWTYFSGREHSADAAEASSTAKSARKAGHVYTNDDVTRQNDKNGAVKYDGKTEKM
jgi:hypothetical protein